MSISSLRIVFLLLLVFYSLKAEDFWQDLITGNPQFKDDQIPHCGFHILLESYRYAQPELLEKIHEYKIEMAQKTYNSIISPSGHFIINYEASGPHAIPTYDRDQNGTPDYLEFVAKSFDRAWFVEIDTLEFKPPPDENGQPKEVYEIFCKRLFLYGQTFFDIDEEIPSLSGNNYPSYIEISTNFSFVSYEGVTDDIVRDSMAIAVTAAHEFNHALQLGYNIWNGSKSEGGFEALDLWYIENSAVFMEEVVANQVNDYYQYLPDFFSSTDQGLTYDSFDYRIYGEVVLNIMMGQLYGRAITREVWQEIVNQPALSALDKVLKGKGSNLERELQRLSEWMFFCGQNSISNKYFPEAVKYPTPEIAVTGDYDIGLQKIAEDQLAPFSFGFFKTVILNNTNLNIYIIPEEIQEVWSGANYSFSQPYSYEFPAKVYSQLPFESVSINNDTLYTAIVAGNWNEGKTDSKIKYSLYLRNFPGNLEKEFFVYPTIVKPDQNIGYITFKNIPANARVEIFSSSGKHISTIYPQFSNDILYWNLKTYQGDKVGSGVYIYSIITPNSSREGKIMVIR